MRWLPIILIAPLLAGCSDDAPTADEDDAPTDGLVIEAPTWSIGDWWTFRNMDRNGTSSTITVVVTGQQGGDWIVDTTDRDQALYDARTDVSYLGEVRKSDLAGSQNGDRVQFFDFPLEMGKTWSTPWEGRTLQMEVGHIYPDGRVHIKAFDGGVHFIDYEYDPETGFFLYVDYRNDDGESVFRMDRTDAGSSFSGEVVRYTLFEPIEIDGGSGAPVEAPFTLDDGVTELAIDVALACSGAGDGLVALQQPGEDGQEDPFRAWQPVSQPEYLLQRQCPADVVDADVIEAMPGPWRLDARITATDGSFTATLEPRGLETITI